MHLPRHCRLSQASSLLVYQVSYEYVYPEAATSTAVELQNCSHVTAVAQQVEPSNYQNMCFGAGSIQSRQLLISGAIPSPRMIVVSKRCYLGGHPLATS